MKKTAAMHRPSLYYHLFRRVYAALCMPAVCLLAGLPLSAQSGDGRIEIPADQITCICASGGPGSISLIAEGSAGPFTFLWAGPGGYISTEQNPADLPAPGWYTCAGGTRQIDCARCEPRRERGNYYLGIQNYYSINGLTLFQNRRYSIFAGRVGLLWQPSTQMFINSEFPYKEYSKQTGMSGALFVGAGVASSDLVRAAIFARKVRSSTFRYELVKLFFKSLRQAIIDQ